VEEFNVTSTAKSGESNNKGYTIIEDINIFKEYKGD